MRVGFGVGGATIARRDGVVVRTRVARDVWRCVE